MSDKLKKFINDHREEFNKAEPSDKLWNKIGAGLEAKSSGWIKSNWLKVVAFSASVLIVAVYFVTKNLDNSSASELALERKDSAVINSEQYIKANQDRSEINGKENTAEKVYDRKNESQVSASTGNSKQNGELSLNKDSAALFENNIPDQKEIKPENSVHSAREAEKPNAGFPVEAKENSLTKKKKTKLYIPEEPVKVNSYSATLYDNSSLCEVIHAYKFPGKVDMDHSGNYTSHRIMSTISCNRLEDMPDVKAIWLKGKTDKKITLSVKKGFKNILLVKGDGRELAPEAISHYYSGLGVIADYNGKYLDMTFKDKVELILFFRDAEEGDKIVIDGLIEAVVKNTP